ncbi:DUF2934 domain-containing protein [Paludibaculum fermentans]|uniref:DUF2934 domain-containing protein n=1 Tax=Paludibaculum fermentans TaxID=1473598 RepID=UPI003EC00C39
MHKNIKRRTHPTDTRLASPAGESFESSPVEDVVFGDIPEGGCNYEEIAALAYQLWNSRGCPIGSPEEDWSRAEGWLRTKEELKRNERLGSQLSSSQYAGFSNR